MSRGVSRFVPLRPLRPRQVVRARTVGSQGAALCASLVVVDVAPDMGRRLLHEEAEPLHDGEAVRRGVRCHGLDVEAPVFECQRSLCLD